MKRAIQTTLIATAAASLAVTSFAACSAKVDDKKQDQKIKCEGVNKCSGKGACKSATNDTCAGKNKCAGKGWVKKTEAECKAEKGKVIK